MSGPASSDLTGKACSPYGFQWTYDTYALAHGTGSAIVKQGGNTWFFITADYAFGHALERDTGDAVKAAGGTVLGVGTRSAQHPGLLLVPAAGPSLQGEGHRACQRRRRYHQFDQAGFRIRHRGRRPKARGAAHLPDRYPLARAQDRARA